MTDEQIWTRLLALARSEAPEERAGAVLDGFRRLDERLVRKRVLAEHGGIVSAIESLAADLGVDLPPALREAVRLRHQLAMFPPSASRPHSRAALEAVGCFQVCDALLAREGDLGPLSPHELSARKHELRVGMSKVCR